MVFLLKKLKSLSSKDACTKIDWKWLSGSGEEDFLILSMYFRYFIIISHWKRVVPFIWKKLNPFSQGCFLPSLVEIDSVVLEKKIFKFCQCIFSIKNYLPWEKGGALHLNKLESPSPKDALCQVWLKLAQWFWRKRFLNFVNVFSLLRIISPWKKAGPFIWIPFTQGFVVPSFVKIGSVVLEKKIF